MGKCSKCGRPRTWYGNRWDCRPCAMARHREYRRRNGARPPCEPDKDGKGIRWARGLEKHPKEYAKWILRCRSRPEDGVQDPRFTRMPRIFKVSHQ